EQKKGGDIAMKSYDHLPVIIRSMKGGGSDLERNIDPLITIYDRISTKSSRDRRFIPFLSA
ncbi:MAG TPA: hypothetical protein PKJ03_10115, partial [Methanoregulaceae archaeon]|nr:hypothetical protein [Methanoregulaceae archaeon]